MKLKSVLINLLKRTPTEKLCVSATDMGNTLEVGHTANSVGFGFCQMSGRSYPGEKNLQRWDLIYIQTLEIGQSFPVKWTVDILG